jgi:RHS repeat-associated protein
MLGKHLLALAFVSVAIPATLPGARGAAMSRPGTPPALGRISAPLVAPETAGRVLRQRGLQRDEHLLGGGADVTPEIQELARALHNDPKLIYEFVKNTIEFVPIFGSIKGAAAALLDGKGNDFDQSSLMIALLRAAGYSPTYIRGVIRLNASQIGNWLGVGTDPDVVGAVLASAGIPATVFINGSGQLTFVDLTHVWVKVTIGGNADVFDPSFKPFTYATGIDLKTAMAYDQATFLAQATQGATVDPNYVQNVNRANVRASLGTYAGKLVDYIKANVPAGKLADVIGGREIQLSRNEAFRTSLPYERSRDEEFTDVPPAYDVLIRIQHLGIDATLAASSTYGKRLTLFYNAQNQPELRLDGTLLATGSAAVPGAYYAITLTADHPYAAGGGTYGDQTFTTSIQAGGQYVIMNGFANTARGLLEKHRQLIQTELENGNDVDSEPVRGETLTAFSLTWLAQVSESEARLDKIARTFTIQHHTLGFAGQLESPYVDIPMALVSVISTEENQAKADASFFTQAGISSAFEWGVFEQTQDHSAVCTVKLIDVSNGKGDKVFDATLANYASVVKPQLVNYSPSELALVEAYINAGFRLTLPQDGSLTELQWTGLGFIAVSPAQDSIAHIISGGLSGGYGSDPWSADPNAIIIVGDPAYWSDLNAQSSEPIDLVKGHYLYDHTDLTVGAETFPLGLGFTRSYNSGGRQVDGALGRGWSHNFDISARRDTDGFQGLGEDSPIDAAGAIAELYVAQDILQGDKTNLRVVTATLAHRWYLEQLIDNLVTVSEGGNTRQFVKLPDGSFNPPPGVADVLTVQGDGSFTLRTKNGIVEDFDTAGKIESWSDPNGNAVAFTYASDKLQSASTTTGRAITLGYSGDHVASVTDGNGRFISYGYDGSGNLITCTDAEGFVTTYEYDQPGRMTKVFRPSFPSVPFVANTYDTQNRVATQANAAGNLFTYYLSGQRAEEVNPAGNSHVLYFDRAGHTIIDADGLGNETALAYDGQGRLTKRTYPEGNAIEFAYDLQHNVTKVTVRPKPPSGKPPSVKQLAYEPVFNRVSSTTDSLGHITKFTYDSRGNLTKVERPAVNGGTPTLLYTYNGRGQVTSETDPEGKVTAYTYDPSSASLLSITEDATGLALTTQMVYDGVGNRIATIDPLLHTTTHQYDDQRQRRQDHAPVPFNYTTRYTFDGDGRITLSERETGDPLDPWQERATSYTATGQVATEVDPQGNTTTFDYDTVDRPARMTDAEGALHGYDTEYQYDAASRLVRVIDGRGVNAEESTYSANGHRKTVKDPNGRTTTYTYDDFDRLLRVAYPDASFEEFTYNAAGSLTKKRTRSGVDITYAYDNLNRLTSKSVPGSGVTQFTYDLAGRITDITGPNGTLHQDYDSAGRLLQVVSEDGKTVQYAYDAAGRRSRLTYPDGYFVAYQYDSLNRLTDIRESGVTLLAHYDYDPLSRRVNVTRGNGTSTSYAYETDDDLFQIGHQFNGDALSLSYTHDRVGNRKTLTSGLGNESYQYDQIYQLTQVDSSTTPAETVYQLDAAGNRMAVVEDGHTTPYASNTLNQYVSVNTASYTYDANGNLTSDDVRSFSYDAENHLLSATTLASQSTYTYDSLGRRIAKSVVPLPAPTRSAHSTHADPFIASIVPPSVTRYAHDGDRMIAEYDGASGALLRRYVYGPRLDEPIVMISAGGARSYYHADALGSTVAMTDDAGHVIETSKYGPYGEPRTPSALQNPYRFAGREFDAETGLYYFRARYYDPHIGRFLQVDPIGYLGGLNLYAYALNNAVNLVDPLGLASESSSNYWRLAGAAGMIGASFIPGVGEAMDLYTLFADDSAWWERGLAVLSLGLNVLTAGAAPNFGAVSRGARVADELVEVGVQANRARGLAAEARVAEELLQEGHVILGSHVAVNTAEGRRVIDHLIQTADGQIIAIEVKSGGAVRNSSQLAKDAALATEGGTLVGKNAPDALRGQTIIITTIERRVP